MSSTTDSESKTPITALDLSKKSIERITNYIEEGNYNQQSLAPLVAIDKTLCDDFHKHLLTLKVLSADHGDGITDIAVFNAVGQTIGHITAVGQADTVGLIRHARNLLTIIKDRNFLVAIEKKVGSSVFDHEADSETTTTLVKTIAIRLKAKTKHEATYKALMKLMKEERFMTVNEAKLSDYTQDDHILSLVLDTAYHNQQPTLLFEGAKYTVTSTIMTE